MAFLDSSGPLDKIGAIGALGVTTLWILGVVLSIPPAQNLVQAVYTIFGTFDAGGKISFEKGHATVISGAYALPLYGIYLPMILGTENAVGRHHRHVYAFWLWLGWLLYNVKFLVEGLDSYGRSPANYFWIAHHCFYVYLHYRWVGNDIRAKLKLS